MFCLYTLPLARPAQAKIQKLTTRWRLIRSNLLSLLKFSQLYLIFWNARNTPPEICRFRWSMARLFPSSSFFWFDFTNQNWICYFVPGNRYRQKSCQRVSILISHSSNQFRLRLFSNLTTSTYLPKIKQYIQ